MKTFNIVVKKTIPYENVANMIEDVVIQGASLYWLEYRKAVEPKEWTFTTPIGDSEGKYLCNVPLNEGGALEFKNIEDDDGKTLVLDLASIEEGLALFAADDSMSHHWDDFISDNGDMVTADVFIQYCLLKSVIYG